VEEAEVSKHKSRTFECSERRLLFRSHLERKVGLHSNERTSDTTCNFLDLFIYLFTTYNHPDSYSECMNRRMVLNFLGGTASNHENLSNNHIFYRDCERKFVVRSQLRPSTSFVAFHCVEKRRLHHVTRSANILLHLGKVHSNLRRQSVCYQNIINRVEVYLARWYQLWNFFCFFVRWPLQLPLTDITPSGLDLRTFFPLFQ